MFAGLRKPTDLIVIVVTLVAYGCPVQAIVHAFGLDERTVASWRERAGQHCEQVHHALVEQGQLDLVHVQADEIRVKGCKMTVWMGLGSSPLSGGRTENLLARASARTFGSGWVGKGSSARPTASLWCDPEGRSNLVAEQFRDGPNMIGESGGHSRSAWLCDVSFASGAVANVAQFVMRPTEVVGGAQQIHTRMQRLQAASRVTALAG